MNAQNPDFLPEYIFDVIETANLLQLQEIMDAIAERYALLSPEWDIFYLALPKNNEDLRRELLQKVLHDYIG